MLFVLLTLGAKALSLTHSVGSKALKQALCDLTFETLGEAAAQLGCSELLVSERLGPQYKAVVPGKDTIGEGGGFPCGGWLSSCLWHCSGTSGCWSPLLMRAIFSQVQDRNRLEARRRDETKRPANWKGRANG